MFPYRIPPDINVELLLSYLPSGSYCVSFKGVHRRNSYNDIVDLEQASNETTIINIARNSLYNVLPEYLFHPIDRFRNLPRSEEKKRFEEEIEKQALEKDNALRFFAPIDLQLLEYRVMIREALRPVTETDSVVIGILGDRLTEQQKKNRFIKKAISFLPSCKYIRGNKTLLTLLLRKLFSDEEITIKPHVGSRVFTDEKPRYNDTIGNSLDSTFVGNTYDEKLLIYEVHYWPEVVDADFLAIVDEIDLLRLFIQDYFLSLEEILHFDISHDEFILRLSDETHHNYLNYNTNL